MPRIRLKHNLYTIIFESDTRAGKAFDVALLIGIVLSVLIVMLESVKSISADFAPELYTIEWAFTVLFTVEYALRIYVLDKPWKYVFSFFGIIDLLSILPTFLGLFIGGAESLIVIRSLRLLRVFRVLKLTRYVGESNDLLRALVASKRKILVFLFAVLSLTVIFGTLMYLIEGGQNGFTSIPKSIYWAIVTLTTVGYGDLSPETWAGQLLASIIMIFGYGIIAVPTGIVTSEMTKRDSSSSTQNACKSCGTEGHQAHAKYCYKCGEEIDLD